MGNWLAEEHISGTSIGMQEETSAILQGTELCGSKEYSAVSVLKQHTPWVDVDGHDTCCVAACC
jgi:hypothetical protein